MLNLCKSRLENELAKYTKEANNIEKESMALKMVESAHNKAFKEIDADINAKTRYSKLKEETALTKEKLKEKQDELAHQEKLADAEHREVIKMENKCRQIAQLLRDHNRGEFVPGPPPEIHENELEDLRKEIEDLEEKMKEDRFKCETLQEKMLSDMRKAQRENEVIRIKLKEKEQECKISTLKVKEIRRSLPRKTLLHMGIKDNTMSNLKVKGPSTHYPGSIRSSKKAFNSTSELHFGFMYF